MLTAFVIQLFVLRRHYIYEQKLDNLTWRIDFKDLLMAEPDVDPTLSEKMKVSG
jgi:hypothetical protein